MDLETTMDLMALVSTTTMRQLRLEFAVEFIDLWDENGPPLSPMSSLRQELEDVEGDLRALNVSPASIPLTMPGVESC